ncbi:PEP-CTERM sorting domain-containing protein [Immundisolibacter cernigliae]|uniref:Ice-binding protein C-terminal domain-containing protein n=1 Tax=Immundisolibacter cernigliae TaxID=1810504 RepID=A0A1B1YPQ6_9GAMM|nr:PEP-CTERM sorting domain-containing protein [Immundisolibacter cernigliae]ANX02744.1 hypothetical protein PG2T_00055 [Immundisolibacter cernigliae]
MKKSLGAMFLTAAVAYAGAASADTIVYYAETGVGGIRQDVDVPLTSPNTRDISIIYDSSLWASITSATLTVLLGDDGGDPPNEYADAVLLEGDDPVVDPLQVTGAATQNYWAIDVADKLLPPDHFTPLAFTLKAVSGDFDYRNAVLTVNFTAVPEPTTTALLGSGLLVAGLVLRRRAS